MMTCDSDSGGHLSEISRNLRRYAGIKDYQDDGLSFRANIWGEDNGTMWGSSRRMRNRGVWWRPCLLNLTIVNIYVNLILWIEKFFSIEQMVKGVWSRSSWILWPLRWPWRSLGSWICWRIWRLSQHITLPRCQEQIMYKIILTHGFVKKTQKTPSNEIAKAENYKRDYFERKGR